MLLLRGGLSGKIGEVFLQGPRQGRDPLLCVELRTELNLREKLSVHEVRKAAVLPEYPAKMSLRDPAVPALRDPGHKILQLPLGVIPAKLRECRSEGLFLPIARIFQGDPEKVFIELLIHRLVKAVVELLQLFPVIMSVGGPDHAVPVEIRPPVLIVDAETRGDRVITGGIPDQIGGPPLFKFCQNHRKTCSPLSPSGKRTVTRSSQSCLS